MLLIATFGLTTFPLLPILATSIPTSLLLPLLLLIVFFLNVSGSYFQSAALSLASLWGSTEILAALSGQGGIAVLISLVQVILAIVSALTSHTNGGTEEEQPSMVAGVGLWGLGTIGAGLCWLAFKYLSAHPAYERITTVIKHVEEEDSHTLGGGSGSGNRNWERTVNVLGKNKLLYLAVALDFAITLVSPHLPITDDPPLDLEFRWKEADHFVVGLSSYHEPDHLDPSTHTPIIEIRRIRPTPFLHIQRSVLAHI